MSNGCLHRGTRKRLSALPTYSSMHCTLKTKCHSPKPPSVHPAKLNSTGHLAARPVPILLIKTHARVRTRTRALPSMIARQCALVHACVRSRYFEADILGAALFPSAVHFLVANFASLFAAPLGTELQQLCIARGWVLVWAVGCPPNPNPLNRTGTPCPSNQRALDPTVLLHVPIGNASAIASVAASDGFNSAWQSALSVRAAGTPTQAAWSARWAAVPAQLRIEPLRAGRCAASTSCVGTLVADGTCVCY